MKRLTLTVILALCILPCAELYAQDYENTPVTISTEKVKLGGELYYSHLVIEKQTLFSISQAYNVSIQDIYNANKDLKLETEGIKVKQIILIPAKGLQEIEIASSSEQVSETTFKESSYSLYITKWYDTLEGIANRYGLTKEQLMAYNGMKNEKLSKRQEIRIPVGEIPEGRLPEIDDSILADIEEVESEVDGERFEIAPKDAVKLSLLLPLNASSNVNDSYFDFYSGVLLAIKDLEVEGIDVRLKVFDTKGKKLDETSISGSDLIIGPVAPEDILAISDLPPHDAYVISPLDPKASELADTLRNVIQAPSSSEDQYWDLVKWIQEDNNPSDRVILISEKGAKTSELATYLDSLKIEHRTLSYSILEGRDISSTLTGMMTDQGINRIVLASEKEAFVNDVMRNINLMIFAKFESVVYASSKVRNFETIEVENLHKAALHTSNSYFVDYESPKVKQFLLKYRALCKTEPTPFAYQGYDTAYYFVSQCARYGNGWPHFSDEGRGLQSNFNIELIEDGGACNTAVRRVVYGEDFSIKLIN